MGGQFIYQIYDGDLSQDEVEAKFHQLVAEAQDHYGDDPYSGSWATTNDCIEFHDQIFNNVKDATDFLDNKANKWSEAWATKCHITKKDANWFTNHDIEKFAGRGHLIWIMGCLAAC